MTILGGEVMLGKRIDRLKFKISVFKVKRSHMKLVKHDLKILWFCIHHLNKICIPTNEAKNETMKRLLSVYDETIAELNKNVEIYRKRVMQ